jgi:hypothetical protein
MLYMRETRLYKVKRPKDEKQGDKTDWVPWLWTPKPKRELE